MTAVATRSLACVTRLTTFKNRSFIYLSFVKISFPITQFSSIFASSFSSSTTAALIVWLLSFISAISSANERLSTSPPCFIQVMSRLVLSLVRISSTGYLRQRPCRLFLHRMSLLDYYSKKQIIQMMPFQFIGGKRMLYICTVVVKPYFLGRLSFAENNTLAFTPWA